MSVQKDLFLDAVQRSVGNHVALLFEVLMTTNLDHDAMIRFSKGVEKVIEAEKKATAAIRASGEWK